MSVWSQIKGSIKYPPNSHFSIKKWFRNSSNIGGEFVYKETKQGEYTIVVISFVAEGKYAAEVISALVQSFPKGTEFDLDSEIRWTN